jgi:uncharacterized protein
MSETEFPMKLPAYDELADSIAILALPISASEVHGILCGYLAAGTPQKGETYLRALLVNHKEKQAREAAMMLFNIFSISQQQITQMGFEFQLMIPDEDNSLLIRAKAFSEWCEGFVQGLTLSGVDYHELQDEDVQDAIHHLTEFANLDYHSLQIDEADEMALVEVTEYARMAVLHIHSGLVAAQVVKDDSEGLPN